MMESRPIFRSSSRYSPAVLKNLPNKVSSALFRLLQSGFEFTTDKREIRPHWDVDRVDALRCSNPTFAKPDKIVADRPVSVEIKKHRADAFGNADLAAELVDRAVLDVGADAGKVSAKLLYNIVSEAAGMGQDLRVAAALFARAL